VRLGSAFPLFSSACQPFGLEHMANSGRQECEELTAIFATTLKRAKTS